LTFGGKTTDQGQHTLVINFNDERPIWSVTDEAVARIRAALPPDWELTRLLQPVSSKGDGPRTSTHEAIAAVKDAEIYIGTGFPVELLRAAQQTATLRWIHTGAAGVKSLLYPEMLASDVILTNSAGIHAEPMAETVLAMILYFARGLDFARNSQMQRSWDQRPFEVVDTSVAEIADETLGILGYGGIGREAARRAEALGMRVLRTRADSMERILRESDFVLVSLPSTNETRHMIGAEQLALMKPHAVLVNVARGDVVVESALIDALQRGALRGAALDVFEQEPLPESSPLWRLPNVLILPHVSATTSRFWERQADLIVENIGRYLRGEPLRNVVDKTRGY
jgi:D-2-hydroxyacid dehydrogenase (NADP+)